MAPEGLLRLNFDIPRASVNQSGAIYEAVFMCKWECIAFSVFTRESMAPNMYETLLLDFTLVIQ